MRRLSLALALSALVTGTFSTTAAQAHHPHRHPRGAKIIMHGTIIDPSCRFVDGLVGVAHRQCAQACADKGVSLVLLTDSELYILTVPGKPAASANAKVKQYVVVEPEAAAVLTRFDQEVRHYEVVAGPQE
jgi:hypothetical protein